MIEPPPTPPPTRMSRAAVLAAMFAVPVCCPPMGALACVTGAVALWQIRRDATLHGRWIAWSAIVVGAVCSITLSWLIWVNGLATIVRGPLPPMQALLSGSPEQVRAEWSGPVAGLDAPTLQAFAEAVKARHGALRDATPSRLRTLPLKPRARQSVATVPVTLVFDRGSVEADLGLELFDERTGATVMRWRSVRLIDATGDDLTFPPGEAPAPLETGNPAPKPGAAPSRTSSPSRPPATPLP